MNENTLTIFTGDDVIASMGFITDMIKGGDKEEFLTIEKAGDDAISMEEGVHNEVILSVDRGNAYIITVTLKQTSENNGKFNQMYLAATKSPGMAGAFYPLLIKDPNGTDLYTEQNAFVMASPSRAFGVKVKTRQWKIGCPHLLEIDGGALPVTS